MNDQSATVTDSLVGQSIGNYEIKSLLGKGAMGEVYLGEHPQIGRKVAIKVLVSALSASKEMAERFQREAQAVNRMDHPNIIQIFDFGTLPDGRLYYTMEYLKGEELTEIINNAAPLSLQDTLVLLMQIVAALDAAHSESIVHRDLKPDNIFVVQKGNAKLVKVLDFGIAKLLEPGLNNQHGTATGMIMGTPMYMSPEQAAGQNEKISMRTDIYALGVIIYQMLSGCLPLQAPSTAQLLAMHITEPPTPLSEVTQGLPEGVCGAVERCLVKEPEDRWASTVEFLDAFKQACMPVPGSTVAHVVRPDLLMTGPGGEVSSIPGFSSVTGPGMSSSIPGRDSMARSGSEMPPSKSKIGLFLGVGGALLLLALAGVGGVLYFGGSDEKEVSSENEEPTKPREAREGGDTEAMGGAGARKVESFTVKVSSKSPGVKVKVSISGQASFVQRAPFPIEAKKGDRLMLEAFHTNYENQVKTVIVKEDREVVFQLDEKKGTRHARRRRRRRRTTSSRGRARRQTRTRTRTTRRPGKTRAGEGTLKPRF